MSPSDYQVVLVDDDKDLLDALSLNLMEEFKVEAFTDPERALTHIASCPPDAIVLDYHMPGKDPLEFYGKLREGSVRPPVLFLTGDHDPRLKVGCLDLGVEDFLHKPISTMELAAHLRNRIRTFRQKNPTLLRLKNLELNLSDPLVTLQGRQLTLTPKEFHILSLLAMNANSVVKKSEIMEKIWPEIKVEDNNVDTHISNLRRKLRDFSGEIKTIKCFGYMIKA